MGGGNLRRHERYAATLTVQVEREGHRRFATIYEVSLGGAFLEISPPPAVGVVLTIVIAWTGGREILLPAQVRYYSGDDRGPRGMEGVGIAWKNLDAERQALVAALVERAQTGRALRGD